jgi:hypothetical protein
MERSLKNRSDGVWQCGGGVRGISVAQATLVTASGGIIAISLAQHVGHTAPTVLASRSEGLRENRLSPLHPKGKTHGEGNLA